MTDPRERIHYYDVGDNYDTKDPFKKQAQQTAQSTDDNLRRHGFSEVASSRGESAYVWKEGNTYRAFNVEGLGTQNLVADNFANFAGRTHYETIGYNTVASIVNDLASVGAKPLVVGAYWAVEDNSWLSKQHAFDLISGWKSGCDDAEASWAGGETPTLKGVIVPDTVDLTGASTGIIGPEYRYLNDGRIKEGDRIILLRSTGVNMNGVSPPAQDASASSQAALHPDIKSKACCLLSHELSSIAQYAPTTRGFAPTETKSFTIDATVLYPIVS